MNILDYFIYSQVILTVLYILYIKFFHKKISFGASRAYLILIAPIALVLPLLSIPIDADLYKYFSSYLPNFFVISENEALNMPIMILTFKQPNLPETFQYLIRITYLTGVVFLLLVFGERIKGALILFYKAKRKVLNGKEIVICPNYKGAFSLFGKIVIGEQSVANYGIAHIVRHEELHCHFVHSADIIIMYAQSSILWFNPAIWHINKLLREVQEFQVDEQMIKKEINPNKYLDLLINFEMGINKPYMENMFSYLSLKNRISMIVGSRVHYNLRLLTTIPVLLCFITFFCIIPAVYDNLDGHNIKPFNTKGVPSNVCVVKPKFIGNYYANHKIWLSKEKDSLQFTTSETLNKCAVKVFIKR